MNKSIKIGVSVARRVIRSANNLLAWWKGSISSGELVDTIGGLNMEVYGRNLLEFDGIGGVLIGDVPALETDDFNCKIIFKATAIDSAMGLISVQNNYTSTVGRCGLGFRITAGGDLQVILEGESGGTNANQQILTSTLTVHIGEIHTAEAIKVGTTLSIILDGVVENFTVLEGIDRITNTTPGTAIGAIVTNNSVSTPLIGSVYYAKINDREYPLAEGGQSGTAYDISGNGNHGTLTGFNLTTAWGWNDEEISPNYLNGFSFNGEARVPSINATTDVLGNPLTNPAGNWHNDSEVVWKAPLNAELQAADTPFDFFYTGGVPNEIGFDDIVADVDDAGVITATVSDTKKYNLKVKQ